MKVIPNSIAIIGGGPSAAFAYRACWDRNIHATVFADKLVHPTGAFYLHELPESTPDHIRKQYEIQVLYSSVGSAEGYSQKMWDKVVPTSFPEESRIEIGYSPDALEWLWMDYEQTIRLCGKLSDTAIASLAMKYDLVVQTFPTQESKKYRNPPISFIVWSRPMVHNERKYTILYSGDISSWCRLTAGGGTLSLEFSPRAAPDKDLLVSGGWTLHRYLDLWPDTKPWTKGPARNVILMGRYAQWDRKILAHEAYARMADILEHGIVGAYSNG